MTIKTLLLISARGSATQAAALGLCSLLAGIALAAEPAPAKPVFEDLGVFRGPGTLGWQGPNAVPPGVLVGPGATPDSETIYLAYTYSGRQRALDLLAVDTKTWRWRQLNNPAPSEYGACMVLGPDGNIYYGTRPNAHILRLDPRTGIVTDLGQPASLEDKSFIYQMTVGADGKIYACTHPSAKLLQCDPATGKLADLGRAAPLDEKIHGEQYGYWIAADKDGFVYESVGIAKPFLIAYDITRGEKHDLLPQAGHYEATKNATVGKTPFVYHGEDDQVYAVLGENYFRLRGKKIERLPAGSAPPEKRVNVLKDGRIVEIGSREIQVIERRTGEIERHAFDYAGRESDVFRLAAGPNGGIYGSSILPLHFFTVDLEARAVHDYGRLGHGEVYSFAALGDKLYMACYGAQDKVPIMIYDPTRRFTPGPERISNPRFVNYPEANTGWRAEAMIAAGGKIYAGSVAPYGQNDGALTVMDPQTLQVSRHLGIIPNQGVITLADAQGKIVGGTTTAGGGGSRPAQGAAQIFLWDPQRQAVVWAKVPVPGATRITSLLTLADGRVMGVATGATRDAARLFVFNPADGAIDYAISFPWRPIYNSVAVTDGGIVRGLVREGIIRFDPGSRSVSLEAASPREITAGFAFADGHLYFASGANVCRYRIP